MSYTAGELGELVEAEVRGDAGLRITGVARIEEAGPGDITFLANPAYAKFLSASRAGAVILKEAPPEGKATYLLTSEPYVAFLKVLQAFYPPAPSPEPGVHPSAVVADDVELGEGSYVGPLCVLEPGVRIGRNTRLTSHIYLGRNAQLGDDCLLYSHVSIREGCKVGNRVILQNGVQIGSDGFGFAPQDQTYLKIPQVGIVVIEDDVEIGANTTVDRATLGETRIKQGVKLDNLVQVAHGVEIGRNTVIAAQSGISGSTKLGEGIMMGGQVGVAGHLRISDGVMVAAQTGLHKDHGPNVAVGGYPSREIKQWRRIEAALTRLPDLITRMRKVEKKLGLDED